jgi:ribosomal protein L22
MKASGKTEGARISLKNSLIVCKHLKGMNLANGKKFLEDLINKRKNLSGKYYTSATKKILEVLENAEANAKAKNLNLDKLFIITKPNKSFKLMTPKSRAKFRGREKKQTNLEIILEER